MKSEQDKWSYKWSYESFCSDDEIDELIESRLAQGEENVPVTWLVDKLRETHPKTETVDVVVLVLTFMRRKFESPKETRAYHLMQCCQCGYAEADDSAWAGWEGGWAGPMGAICRNCGTRPQASDEWLFGGGLK